MRLLQSRFGLLHLLVEFGCGQFGKRLTGLHTIADVGGALHQVTFRPGENRGLCNRLNIPRQFEAHGPLSLLGVGHNDSRQRAGFLSRRLYSLFVSLAPGDVANNEDDRKKANQQNGYDRYRA